MTVAEAINTVLNYTENVSATDAGNASRRTRIRQWAQEAVEYVRNYRNWRFLYKTSTCAITSDGTAILPSDFSRFGWSGGLLNSDGTPLVECQDAKDLFVRFTAGQRNTEEFALLGYDDTTSSPKIQTLQVSGTLSVLYCKQVPTLVDSTTLPSDNSLQLPIPQDYHNTVIIPRMAMKSKQSKGDVRDFQSEFLFGLDLMCKNEQTMQGDAQTMPYSR